MRILGVALAWWLGCVAAAAVAKDTRFDVPPPVAVLEAKLVCDQTTYTLDPEQRGEQFRKRLKTADSDAGGIAPKRLMIQNLQIQAAPAMPKAVPAKPPAKKDHPEAKAAKKQADEAKPAKDNAKAGPPAEKAQPAAEKEPQQPKPEKDKAQAKPKAAAGGAIQVQGGQIQIGGRGGGIQIIQGGGAQGIRIQAQIQVQGGGPAQARVVVLGGAARPQPPEVDLAIELRNHSAETLSVGVGGEGAVLDLKLEGPGAVTVGDPPNVQVTVRGSRTTEIPAGGTHRIPIRRLQHGENGRTWSYWTEPGVYTLSATLKTTYTPASGGQPTPIELSAGPVKLKVVAPDGDQAETSGAAAAADNADSSGDGDAGDAGE